MACFWSKWKAQKFERQAHYDCKTCLVNKWIEKQGRVCFLESEQTVYFPVFQTVDEKGEDIKPKQEMENGQFKYREELEVSKEDMYKWLVEMENLYPQMPALDCLQSYCRPVCIESLIDPYIYRIMALESAVSAYGVGALDLPLEVFTEFEMIRSSNSFYDLLQNYKTESELKSKQK